MKYKRNIFILTDDVDLVNKKYVKHFKRAEYASTVLVDNINNLSAGILTQINNAKNTILFLTDAEKYVNDLFLNSAIIHIVENQDIDYIVVDSIENWRSIEEQFDENNEEVQNKVWTYKENLFDWYHLKPLIRILQENATPENIVIAFVSDNCRYIDKLFDHLLDEWNGRNDNDDGDGKDGPVNSNKHLPISSKLPRIFMGWIWRIWYAPIKPDYKHFDSDVKEEQDTDVIGYVRRSVMLNLGDRVFTYIHIVPSIVLDLTPILDDINALYFDLNTYYGSLMFDQRKNRYPSHVNYIPFLSRVKFRLYETPDWLNVLKNYVDVADQLVNLKEYSIRNNFTEDKLDKLTGTITTAEGGLKVPLISIIKSIDPPETTKDEDTDDDDN